MQRVLPGTREEVQYKECCQGHVKKFDARSVAEDTKKFKTESFPRSPFDTHAETATNITKCRFLYMASTKAFRFKEKRKKELFTAFLL